MFKSICCLVSLFLLLVACGGGSQGEEVQDNTDEQNTLLSQNIYFELEGDQALYAGETMNNTAIGDGVGVITYASSDTNIAIVDSLGAVTAIAKGSTSISATIEADSAYLSASASYTLEVFNIETVNFEFPSRKILVEGDTYLNIATGSGEGKITYSVSDPSVATVDAISGEVTAIGYGSITVMAIQSASNENSEAYNQYVITVVAKDISLHLSIGASNTRITSTEASNEVLLRSTSQVNCMWNETEHCINYQADELSSNTEVLNDLGNNDNSFYQLSANNKTAYFDIGTDKFKERSDHNVVSFNGKLYLVGGAKNSTFYSDVWSSIDGRYWLKLASDAFPARKNFGMTTFKNKLWIAGGEDLDNTFNDVWSSVDGVNWIQETSSANWRERSAHQLVSWNDNLFLIGGKVSGIYANSEIWSSTDGINWQQEADAPFGERYDHKIATLENKLWVYGGNSDSTKPKSVWSSANAIDWIKITDNTGFSGRVGAELTSHNGYLWVTGGGYDTTYSQDAWRSLDGITWEKYGTLARKRYSHATVSHNEKLYVIGGGEDALDETKTVLVSPDGQDWQELSLGANFEERTAHQTTVFNNKLYVVGGAGNLTAMLSDTWSSIDGYSWQQSTSSSDFTATFLHQMVAFDGALWIIGGYFYGNSNAIWRSEDGISWEVVNSSPSFGKRSQHQVTYFNGKLWLIGGYANGSSQGDIWSSTNGIHWTLAVEDAGYTARYGHSVASFNNKLWLIGGIIKSTGTYSNDVWSSEDGINWQQETEAAVFDRRTEFTLTEFNEKLWLIGGYTSARTQTNEIYSSSDGISWHLESDSASFFGRQGHTVTEFNNKLYLIGGWDNDNVHSDVWTSENGRDWSLLMKIDASLN